MYLYSVVFFFLKSFVAVFVVLLLSFRGVAGVETAAMGGRHRRRGPGPGFPLKSSSPGAALPFTGKLLPDEGGTKACASCPSPVQSGSVVVCAGCR